MTIRPITPADVSEWSRMRSLLWPGHCHDNEIAAFFKGALREPEIVLVAPRDDGSLCGFVEVSVRHDYVEGASSTPVAYIEGWYVDPEFRGGGLGRKLIGAAEAWAAARGFAELASDAAPDNEHSIRAHRLLGFAEAGRSVHFIKRVEKRD